MKKLKLSNLNIADWLSISRIIVAPFLILIMLFSTRIVFSIIFVLGVFTDFLDGFLARKKDMTSKLGARLDSTGDFLIFISGVIGIFYYERSFVMDHIWWIIAALALYFFQLFYAILKYKKPSSFHTYSAKTAAALQGIFISASLFFGIWEWLFWIALAISIFETIEEIILIYILDEWRTDVKGIYWLLKEEN